VIEEKNLNDDEILLVVLQMLCRTKS